MSEHTVNDEGTVHTADLLRTGFSVRSQDSAGVVVLRLQGELDMATVVDLRRAVAEELERKPSALALDLGELSFIDSSGIGSLVGASRFAKERGCTFTLRSPTRPVRKALHLTGVDQLMAIEDQTPPA